jgi:hypothetical protein
MSEDLKNHEVTICLEGGAVLGPFNAIWSQDRPTDIRELCLEYEEFLHGKPQKRFKFHLHDSANKVAHSLIIDFKNVTSIYDRVALH